MEHSFKMDDLNRDKIGTADLGERLRVIRSMRGFTIRALAEKSGLNVNTISMIENGKSSPSVRILQKIALALGIPITSFFETNLPKTNLVFQKQDQRTQIRFTHGTMDDLGSDLSRNNLEPFQVSLEPRSSSGRVMIVHIGLELVYCLDGRLAYTVEDQVYQLEQGDSLFFEAQMPHRWRNAGDTACHFLLILSRDRENDLPKETHFLPVRKDYS